MANVVSHNIMCDVHFWNAYSSLGSRTGHVCVYVDQESSNDMVR